MSGIGYYYDENGVKQEIEIGPSFDDFPGMAKVTSPYQYAMHAEKQILMKKVMKLYAKYTGRYQTNT